MKNKDKEFEVIFQEACDAGNAAAKKWLENAKPRFVVRDGNTNDFLGTLLDLCGNAYISIDKRSSFAKWYKKNFNHGRIHIFHEFYSRQEVGLHEAACEAACKVLKKYGINCWVNSYID